MLSVDFGGFNHEPVLSKLINFMILNLNEDVRM